MGTELKMRTKRYLQNHVVNLKWTKEITRLVGVDTTVVVHGAGGGEVVGVQR